MDINALALSVLGSFIAEGVIDLLRSIKTSIKTKAETLDNLIIDEVTLNKILELAIGAYILLIWDQRKDEESRGGWGKSLGHYGISAYPEIYSRKKEIPKDSVTHTRWAIQGLVTFDPTFRYSTFAKDTKDYLDRLSDPKSSGTYGRFKTIGRDDWRRAFEPNLRHTAGAIHTLLMLNDNKPNADIQKSLQCLLNNQNDWLLDEGRSHYHPAIADITAGLVASKQTILGEIFEEKLSAAINASAAVLVKGLQGNYWEKGHPRAELLRTLWILRDYDFSEHFPEMFWRLVENIGGLFRRNSCIMPLTSSGEGVSLGNAASLFILLDDVVKKGNARRDGKEDWCIELQQDLIKFIAEKSDDLTAHEFDFCFAWSEILSMAGRCLEIQEPLAKELQMKLKNLPKRFKSEVKETSIAKDEDSFLRRIVIPVAIVRKLLSD